MRALVMSGARKLEHFATKRKHLALPHYVGLAWLARVCWKTGTS
ncbi:hypothetical protein [Mesorhizobium sp. M0323]